MDDALGAPPPLTADLPAQNANPSAPAEQFPCPQCGASLRYDPTSQGLACAHCGWTRPVDAATPEAHIRELDYRAALGAQVLDAPTEETRVIACESCGAATTLGPLEQAGLCPFCAAPLVDAAGARRSIAPQGVLPFLVPEDDAKRALRRWLAGRWFAPGDLEERARAGGRPLNGVYLPFWTFDADTRSSYDGARGDAYYDKQWVTVTVKGRNVRRAQRVRKIRWRSVSGRVARAFDDVLVLASHALPQRFIKRFENAAWDLSALEPYRPAYLAGFRAEIYAIDLVDGYAAACDAMDAVIRGDVRRDIGGDAQRIYAVRTERRDVTFKHVLLPVWIAAYRYGGKPYRFVVNGRTGEVIGERPYSWWKIAATVLGGLALLGGALYALNAAGAFS